MICNNSRYFFALAAFVCLLFGGRMTAQEVILKEVPGEQVFVPVNHPTYKIASTDEDTLTLPFFDDFAYDSLRPSCFHWSRLNNVNLPFITRVQASAAPTKGVLTFNGAGFEQQIYDCNNRGSGITDSIVSLPIDLSGKSSASNIFLSFKYQRGGLVDSPESNDSLLLYFQSKDTIYTANDTIITFPWVKVWEAAGTGSSDSQFFNAIVKVESAAYFRPDFRFKIASFGNLNGVFDNWHVDYVMLDEGRTPSDTIFNDASIIAHTQSLFTDNFTAIPRDHLPGTHLGNMGLQLQNIGNSTQNRTLTVQLSDTVPGHTFSGNFSETKSVTIGAQSSSLELTNTFTSQSFSQKGVYKMEAFLDGSDAVAQNDTLTVEFSVGEVYGYDDGQAEAGYGLQSTRGYGMQYYVPTPDTLSAAWIQFVPSIHYNGTTTDVTCMDGYGFRLNIWSHDPVNHRPDTIIETQLANMTVDYGTGPFDYIRFRLNDTVIVQDTFYIGISQVDNKALGVGLDLTYDNSNRFFFQNSGGQWETSASGGTLMVRPEFGKYVSPFAGIEEMANAGRRMKVYPNPAFGDEITLDFPGEGQLKNASLVLRDLQGRELWQTSSSVLQFPYQIDFDRRPVSGIYLLEVSGQTAGGAVVHEVNKVIFR